MINPKMFWPMCILIAVLGFCVLRGAEAIAVLLHAHIHWSWQ